MGLREFAYRKAAIRELRLKPGNTVLEIGCGTGLNFGLLQQQVGPQGRITGIDAEQQGRVPGVLALSSNILVKAKWHVTI